MALLLVLCAVMPLFALILVGWFAGRRGWLGEGALPAINAYVVRLALPALLFQVLAEADWRVLWQPGFLVAFGGGTAATFLLSMLLASRGGTLADRSIAGLAGGYANTAFVGIPLAGALIGPTGTRAAVLASILTVCVLFAGAVLLIELSLNRADGWLRSARRAVAAVAANPLVVAPAAGAVWTTLHAPVPAALHQFLTLLGSSASPCALVTLGLFLGERRSGRAPTAAIVRLSAAKLIVQPAVTAALLLVVRAPADWGRAALLIAALPTGTGPFLAAQLYRRDMRLSSATMLTTTLLALVTLPLLTWIVGSEPVR